MNKPETFKNNYVNYKEKSQLQLGIILLVGFFGLPIIFSFSMLKATHSSIRNLIVEEEELNDLKIANYQMLMSTVREMCVGEHSSGTQCAQLALDYLDVNETEMANLIVQHYSNQNIDSHDDENLKKWSKTFVKVGQADKGLQLLNEALEIRPGNKKILTERSNVFHQLKRFDKALEDLAHVLIQDPDDEVVFSSIVSYLKEAGEVKGSEYLEKNKPVLQKAIRNPDNAMKILDFIVKRAPHSSTGSKSKSESK